MRKEKLGPSGWPLKIEREARKQARVAYARAKRDGSVTCSFNEYFGQWMANFAG